MGDLLAISRILAGSPTRKTPAGEDHPWREAIVFQKDRSIVQPRSKPDRLLWCQAGHRFDQPFHGVDTLLEGGSLALGQLNLDDPLHAAGA